MKEFMRDDWGEVKEKIMLLALRSKFMQHPELRTLLVSTNPKRLVESTANDSIGVNLLMVLVKID